MNSNLSPEQLAQVRSHLAAGNKIMAIKVYREITGLGLAEAKDAIEQMGADGNAPAQSRLPTNAPQKSGCLGMIALLVMTVALAVWRPL